MLDLDQLTIVGLRALLLSRQVSAEEAIGAVLARVAATEPLIHAYVHVLADEALNAARLADRELVRGSTKPLLGVPFGAKDVFWTADAPTQAGSPLLRGFRP